MKYSTYQFDHVENPYQWVAANEGPYDICHQPWILNGNWTDLQVTKSTFLW